MTGGSRESLWAFQSMELMADAGGSGAAAAYRREALSPEDPSIPPWQQTLIDRCHHPLGGWQPWQEKPNLKSISDYFVRAATQFPQRPAVDDGSHTLTYAQLDRASNCIAQALGAAEVDASPVALFFDTDIPLIVGLLAALKSGRPFVLCNPQDPMAYTRSVLERAEAGLVMTSRAIVAANPNLLPDDRPRLVVDSVPWDRHCAPPRRTVSGVDVAYISFTSGSTGQPKGIVTTHRAVLERVGQWINAFHLSPHDRCALLRPALVLLFGALFTGAALPIWDHRRRGLSGLGGWLAQSEISLLYMGATGLRQFLRQQSQPLMLPALRLLLQSGEKFYATDADLLWRSFTHLPLVGNLLMCREVGLIRRYFLPPSQAVDSPVVPVGYGVSGVQVELLGADGRPVANGLSGEIAVKSQATVPGYWNDREQTDTRFRPGEKGETLYLTGDMGRELEDGCLLYLGRTDFQRKIRGYRVELEEVEETIRRLELAQDVVAVVRQEPTGEESLVAYLEMGNQRRPAISELRRCLAQMLPEPLIPSAFVFLEALPLNVNGRVDRRALPPPSGHRPRLDSGYFPATTPVERIIADIWQTVLYLDAVGVHDPFLELGGNSLQAMRIAARVHEEFGVDIPLAELFAATTVAEMALVVAAGLVEDANLLETSI